MEVGPWLRPMEVACEHAPPRRALLGGTDRGAGDHGPSTGGGPAAGEGLSPPRWAGELAKRLEPQHDDASAMAAVRARLDAMEPPSPEEWAIRAAELRAEGPPTGGRGPVMDRLDLMAWRLAVNYVTIGEASHEADPCEPRPWADQTDPMGHGREDRPHEQ